MITMTTLVIINAVMGAFVCAYLAKEKGKDPVNWVVLGLMFGLFAILAIGFSTSVSSKSDTTTLQTDSMDSHPGSELKKCPACAEHIKLEALKCRFCGEVFDQRQVQKEIEDWRRKRQKGLTESELPDDEESTPGLLTYLQEMHESGNALKVCSHCEHLSSEVCRKLRFNVRDYPKRFTAICNGEHFQSRSTQ